MFNYGLEDCKLKMGINFWFPMKENVFNKTLFSLIILIPYWCWYDETYIEWDGGDRWKGWRFKCLYLRYRRRNKNSFEPRTKLNLFCFSTITHNGKQVLIETREEIEDRYCNHLTNKQNSERI